MSFDAVIVGAGPAGCSAACFLARKGYRVLLLDKARFPRDKTCGDGISASSIQVMEEMGAMDFVEAGAQWCKCRSIVLSSPSGMVINAPTSHKEGLRDYGLVIPRQELDHRLVQYTKQLPGVTFLENTKITGITRGGENVRGVTDGQQEFIGHCIISAEGHYSVIARNLKRSPIKPKYLGFALRGYFSQVEGLEESIGLHYEKSILPGYGWIFPVGPKRANVGVGVLVRFKSYHGIKDLFNSFIENNSFARFHLKNAQLETGTLKAWPLPLGCAPGKRAYKNVLLVGDAGQFVDPLNGEGIYYALKSGKYAALAIEKALNLNSPQQAGAFYERLWKKEFALQEFTSAYLMQPFLNSRRFVDLTIKLVSKNEKRAQLLAGVIAHKEKKASLLKLPFL
jgi:geranylgeranyl reductase family protein